MKDLWGWASTIWVKLAATSAGVLKCLPSTGSSDAEIAYSNRDRAGNFLGLCTVSALQVFTGSRLNDMEALRSMQYCESVQTAALAPTGTATILTPTASRKLRILGVVLSADAATLGFLYGQSGGGDVLQCYTPANDAVALTLPLNGRSLGTNEPLAIQNLGGVAATYAVTVYYTEE